MLTIFDPVVRIQLEDRVRGLRPDSARRWGRMSPHQALCHMTDMFRMALGEKDVASRPAPFSAVVRFAALRLPVNWPPGIGTLPELEQGRGGTTPVDFERDRAELLAYIARFGASTPEARASTHPFLGTMTTEEWGHWAYRHLNHHLRQFGV